MRAGRWLHRLLKRRVVVINVAEVADPMRKCYALREEQERNEYDVEGGLTSDHSNYRFAGSL